MAATSATINFQQFLYQNSRIIICKGICIQLPVIVSVTKVDSEENTPESVE